MELNHNNFVLIILIVIIFTQIYQFYEEPICKMIKNKNILNKKENKTVKKENVQENVQENIQENLPKKVEKKVRFNTNVEEKTFEPEESQPKLDIRIFGTPNNVFDNNGERILEWEFSKPNPWSKIYYNTANDTVSFGIKHKVIPQIIDEWERILPNIGCNDNLILITTKDEETALGIINLVLSTLNNEMTIKDVLDNNLINISVGKIKSHPLVKNKILEQILSKITVKEEFKSEVTADLADKSSKSTFGFEAYGGNEYQFIN